jgi:hypothetical protein
MSRIKGQIRKVSLVPWDFGTIEQEINPITFKYGKLKLFAVHHKIDAKGAAVVQRL